uniref:Replication protein A OB domain-containing protein n=1 Tax=Amphimedon queenslandica TaxID=400682 RepID=A0A1X7U809_AMPQE
MTDGIKAARFISFEPSLRPTFAKFKEDDCPVAVAGCHIQENKFDSTLEIKTGKHTVISQSPKKFKVDTSAQAEDNSSIITTDQIITIGVNQQITIVGKIVNAGATVDITTKNGKKLKKQYCILHDTNGSCRIVLWEDDIGKVEKGNCYKLINILVRQYDSVKYLSISEGTIIERIDNIELISDSEDLQDVPQIMVAEGEISAVLYINDYSVCISCNGNVQSTDGNIGRCIKCSATVKMSKCIAHQSARFIVTSSTRKNWQLTAYNEQLKTMTKNVMGESLTEKLLNIDQVKLTYDSNNIVKNVTTT